MTAIEGPSAPKTIYERFSFLRPIEARGQMPNHVAIIMDGNRTWAKKTLGETAKPIDGHQKGMENIIEILRDLRQIKTIKYVTLWAFSTENWNRTPEEVADLMRLFEKGIPAMLPDIQTANGRFVHLGRKDRVPQAVRDAIEAAEAETAQNTGQVVCLGIDYGAEDQELRAMEKLLAIELPKGTEIAPELLKRLNDTHLADGTNIPPIDLVFRTSGQQRLSGLPNADYAELCTIAACLPDATIGDFVNGLVNYSGRERRFGGNCATK